MITITIPVFNRPALVQSAIASVLAQTSDQWELIVVDDGSKDGTLGAAQRAVAGCKKAYVISIPHIGQPGIVKNIGIRAGKGSYVAALDSDDTLAPTAVEEVLQVFSEHPDLDVVYTDRVMVGHGPEHLGVNCLIPYSMEGMLHHCLIRQLTVVRRWMFEAVGGFGRVPFADDYEMGMRLSELAQVHHLQRPLYRFNHDHEIPSVTTTQRAAQRRAVQQIQRQAYLRRGMTPPDHLQPKES
jgi:glycosyltransferase involved in cell wall biosynthesis